MIEELYTLTIKRSETVSIKQVVHSLYEMIGGSHYNTYPSPPAVEFEVTKIEPDA